MRTCVSGWKATGRDPIEVLWHRFATGVSAVPRASRARGEQTMADPNILERVTKATGRVLGLDPSEIPPGANFVFDLGAESMQGVALVAAFEAEFDVEMDQEQALAVQTVEGAAEFVAKCLERRNATL